MRHHLAAALALLVLFACAQCFGAAPLPPAPANGYCSDGSNATGFFGVRDCPDQTPPPNDPGAYTSLVVTWLFHQEQGHPINPTLTVDARSFWNFFGRIRPIDPIQQWPGASGTTLQYRDSGPKYLRLPFTVPLNPGNAYHTLSVVSYGTTAGAVVKAAMVSPGAAWPPAGMPASGCWNPGAVGRGGIDAPLLTITTGTANTTRCSGVPGRSYEILIDVTPNAQVALSLT
jgi:hypothetical protein